MATPPPNHHQYWRPNSTIHPIDPRRGDSGLEMNESDIWYKKDDKIDDDDRLEKPISVAPSRKSRHQRKLIGNSSLPINVPDWSKMSKSNECIRKHHDDINDDNDEWLPPHEYLARTRMASLSVNEGSGRTLKGRDLSRVRNAIWKETGFEQD